MTLLQFVGLVCDYELRTIAVLGNLGWDTPRDVLIQRAKEVLNEAGIDSLAFFGIAPVTNREGKGSRVELCFKQATSLQIANVAVKALNKTYTNNHYVWLDAKREKSEGKPGRIVHRMFDWLTDLEAGKDQPLQVEKFINGKFIKVGGNRAGFTFKGEWMWTKWASSNYDKETLDLAKAFAEGE